MRALGKAKTTVSLSEFAVCRGYGNGGNARRIGHARCVLRSDAPSLQNLLFQEFSATLPLSVTRRNPFRPRFAVAGFCFSESPEPAPAAQLVFQITLAFFEARNQPVRTRLPSLLFSVQGFKSPRHSLQLLLLS